MPHNFVIRQGNTGPTDAGASDSAFSRACLPINVQVGLKTGKDQQVMFKANSIYFVRGVSGHAFGGQYGKLVVSRTARMASFQ